METVYVPKFLKDHTGMDVMKTVNVPKFLKDQLGMEVFRRLEVFTNLSARFTRQVLDGNDNSVQTMWTLLQHPPLQGLPVMNGALDLLKDVVFSYQATTRLTGSGQAACSQASSPKTNNTPAFEMFPRQLSPTLNTFYKSLKDAIAEHKVVVNKFKDAQQGYMKQYNYLQQLVRKNKAARSAQADPSDSTLASTPSIQTEKTLKAAHTPPLHVNPTKVNKTTHALQLKATPVTEKKRDKLRAQMEKQNDVAMKALVRVIVFRQRERQLRDGKLTQIECTLRQMIEDRIAEALKSGLDHLVEIGRTFALPDSVMDRVDQFDVQYAGSQIYTNMATRYIFPTIEYFANDMLVPDCRFETPDLRVLDKHDIQLGKSGSCIDLLHEALVERRREELYVWACRDSTHKKPDVSLNFAKGQKVKQKLCSSDGKLAFGWTRLVPGGCKTFGFYPTLSVHLVP